MLSDKELVIIFYRTLAEKKKTLSAAAAEMGTAPETVSRWKKTEKIGRGKRELLAAWFASNGIDLEREELILRGNSAKTGDVVFLKNDDLTPVPLLTTAQAAQMCSDPVKFADEILDGETAYFDQVSVGDFAVLVSGRSMMPWYPPGTRVLVGKNLQPQTGDRVIACIADYAEPIFKIYVDLGGQFALLSINKQEGCEPIIIDKMDRAAWFWLYPIKASIRHEHDIDQAMKAHGIHHFWEPWVEEFLAEKQNQGS